jgi:hypothetical protein
VSEWGVPIHWGKCNLNVEIRVISLEKQTFQQFEISKLIRAIQNISEISKEMRLADKCLENSVMPFFWADCLKKWGK